MEYRKLNLNNPNSITPDSKYSLKDRITIGSVLNRNPDMHNCYSSRYGAPCSIDEIAAGWKQSAMNRAAGIRPETTNLYVHFAYCKSKCSYCMYKSFPTKDRRKPKRQLASILAECERISPAFEHVELDNAYFGGGTQTIYRDDDYEQLVRTVLESFSFKSGADITCEMHPVSANFNKIESAMSSGINRISIGVQSLSEDVLKNAGRGYQRADHVKYTIRDLKSQGIPEVNADLVAYLHGETKESFAHGLRKLAEFHPDTITLYRVQLNNEINKRYREIIENDKQDWDEITEVFSSVTAEFSYENVVRNRNAAVAVCNPEIIEKYDKRQDMEFETQSVIGLGYLAQSLIHGVSDYINASLSPEGNPRKLKKPYLRITRDPDTEAGIFACSHARSMVALPIRRFEKCFGKDPLAYFAPQFDFLKKKGLVDIGPEKITWNFTTQEDAMWLSAIFYSDALLDLASASA